MLLPFFFITDLYLLIPAVITQIFNPTAKLAIPTRIATNEANGEMETQPVTIEVKITKCSVKFKFINVFLCFLLINPLSFISPKK